MKQVILVLGLLFCLNQLQAQICDEVRLSVNSNPNIDFSFDTFGEYLGGITQNGSTKLKVAVSNSLNNNPACRWSLVIYVENASVATPPTEWEQLQSSSTSGATPKIEMLQLRIRNNCNTSQTGNQFFNVPATTGTPIIVISNNGITTPAGSCTTNVNGPGNATANYNEFNFDVDYRILPTAGVRSGIFQLKVKYLLTEFL
ncbi:MAG: hypothetical protein KBE91_03070 [Bacteroidia bacterium]|nr:hypothetical protein [Bacteroidia bacterium]MBP9688564.1 hypothetical protein [Bacteroidia bacterium]